MDGIGGLFQSLADAIVGLFGGMVRAFGDAIQGAFTAVQSILPGPWLPIVGVALVLFLFWQFIKR